MLAIDQDPDREPPPLQVPLRDGRTSTSVSAKRSATRRPTRRDRPMAKLARIQKSITASRATHDRSTGFETENPFTGQPWALIPRGGPADVDRAVAAAHRAFSSGDWRSFSPTKRGALLGKLADLVAASTRVARRKSRSATTASCTRR